VFEEFNEPCGGYIASLKGVSFHRCDARCRKRRLREPEKPKHPVADIKKSAARRQVVQFYLNAGNPVDLQRVR